MKKYLIIRTYEIEADSEDEAIEIMREAENEIDFLVDEEVKEK